MADNLNITNQPIQPTKLTPKPRSLISSQHKASLSFWVCTVRQRFILTLVTLWINKFIDCHIVLFECYRYCTDTYILPTDQYPYTAIGITNNTQTLHRNNQTNNDTGFKVTPQKESYSGHLWRRSILYIPSERYLIPRGPPADPSNDPSCSKCATV